MAAALVLALVGGTAGCGEEASGTTKETASVADTTQTVIIDVRTPEEFSQGHVQGAINHDLLGGDFETVLPGLDKNQTYKLYCRSGNRSGQAMALMQQAGFDKVENLGSLQEAADALNTPIVTD